MPGQEDRMQADVRHITWSEAWELMRVTNKMQLSSSKPTVLEMRRTRLDSHLARLPSSKRSTCVV